MALRSTLRKTFAEMDAPAPVKPPNRPNHTLRAIEQGLNLIRRKGLRKTCPITGAAYDLNGLSVNQCAKVMSAARLYGDPPSLVEKLTKKALFVLCSVPSPKRSERPWSTAYTLARRFTAPEIKRMRAQA